jgi:hypothetical protein
MAAAGATVDVAPAVADGLVYVPGPDLSAGLEAYSVDCAGFVTVCPRRWKAITSPIGSSPVIANGFVYAADDSGIFGAYQVNCATGLGPCDTSCPGSPGAYCDEAWQGGVANRINGSPAVSSGIVYIGADPGLAAAYDVASCASKRGSCDALWVGSLGDNKGTRSSPAAADGMVYFGSEDGRLYAYAVGCVNAYRACEPRWTAITGDGIDSSPAVADGVVYVGSRDGKLYADAVGCPSGSPCLPLWTATPGDGIDSSPTVANGVVYVASRDGRLNAYAVGCASDGGTCTPLWSADIGGSSALPTSFDMSPVVANGAVYVGSYDGNLYAFSLYGATPPATSTAESQPLTDPGTPTLTGAIGLAAFLVGTLVALGRRRRSTAPIDGYLSVNRPA